MDFYELGCGFAAPTFCKDVCKERGCTGNGTCVDDWYCSCTGCNCFFALGCAYSTDPCGATCKENGCTGPTKICSGDTMCCCDGCGKATAKHT